MVSSYISPIIPSETESRMSPSGSGQEAKRAEHLFQGSGVGQPGWVTKVPAVLGWAG